ncbi:molybdate ABC transporter permease subunit [Aestuariibacter halophilus]|uniref:Molybdenum transport system permease n=1 Tax=Fluctibacter halophilus TaxID=226011 RepID=A0ABS8G4I8_9ALTE|nr:molybdate ABC transporter permease subunit [Aestuariibacter halophilus]MCC2615348.1 molybdate ABC transporter permease subunit [Aestuariibacter halophilus]
MHSLLSEGDLEAIFLTLQLALVSTVLLLLVSLPLAWWLAKSRWRFRFVIEACVALPLVLPPTVLGFYLLLLLSQQGPLAQLGLGTLAFSFEGLVIGSMVYSLPFVVQPIQQAFRDIPDPTLEAAATLGAGPIDRFFSVVVPMTLPGILSAATLGFAHTLGEFGVVLMIGGNIPGQTQVASIALYEHVESIDFIAAHQLAATMLVIALVLMLTVYALNRRVRGLGR